MAQHLGRINNCAWLCPARAGASSIHVCATLGDPHKLLPWPNLFLAFAFPTCLRHACLPDAWLAFVFLQTLHSPRANLQPPAASFGYRPAWFQVRVQLAAERCRQKLFCAVWYWAQVMRFLSVTAGTRALPSPLSHC